MSIVDYWLVSEIRGIASRRWALSALPATPVMLNRPPVAVERNPADAVLPRLLYMRCELFPTL